MDGNTTAAILQVVVQNLIDHSKKEISLIRGLDKDAAKLAGSLDTIQKFLNDAETRSNPGEAVKNWLKKLEDVAFDADNVLDELNYHLLSKQIKPIKPIKEKVISCFSSFNSIARPRNMALRIKEINENLESLHTEAARLGLVERLATDVPSLPDAAFETDSFKAVPIFIGRDVVMSDIVEMLTNSITTNERKISIISIVGMGGLGKTTLTKKVFHDQKIKTEFGSCIWVHVSQKFDSITLFKNILKELTSDQGETRQDIMKKLQESLKDKTYLLVLDNVWNEDLQKWEDFMDSLLGVTSTNGNAIVVTTRNMEVASIVNPLHIHQLEGLSEDHCWSIIKAKTFGKEDVPSEFETIGRNIARRCQGLPLAANVVGGVLRNKSEENWLLIEEKWLSRNEGDGITKILRLSFDNLSPPSLKKCFAYCSVIPKGYGLVKQGLIEKWMAEGFLQPDESNDMESVGDKFMNVLIQKSLLQIDERDDYGNVQVCGMHDLVHDLASSVLGSSINADGSSRIRYLFVERNHFGDKSNPIQKEVAKYLRALYLNGEISGIEFSDFECLHALALDSFGVEEFPSSIRKLIHLRDLEISDTITQYLPDWIGELHHLVTLRAENLKKLPSTIEYLINLRHLYINGDVELPAKIGRLTSLQTLTHFKVGDKNGCKIGELGLLNNLKGKIQICSLERVHDKEEAEKANLFKKSKILELCLKWKENREGETNDKNVLEGLQPHSDLKKLVIVGFKGKRFPSWTLNMAVRNVPQGSLVGLNKLIEITLLECSECEEIPMLGHLPNLKSLRLKRLSNVKFINSSFYGLVNNATRIAFPALEKLKLVHMEKLAKWAKVEFAGATEVKVFPHLQYLEISHCDQLMSTPTHFSSCLKHLSIGWIDSSMPLANIFQMKLTLLTKLCLVRINEVECLPDWLFYNNPNLSKIKIYYCPKLRELPDGLCTLNSLEELSIRDCRNLERIADSGREQSQSQGSLRHLEIRRCDALVYFPFEIVGSSLEKLSLVELSSLKNLPSLIDRLAKSPRLTEMIILGVPKFMATYCVESWRFGSLRSTDMDVSMGGSGSMETVDGILKGCCSHTLDRLTLKGMERWECLPESIQHLTASTSLSLKNFGMEELPEWLGNLSSLYRLCLYDCKKLRRLPSTDAMQRLTKLKRLTIAGCPELHIQQQSDGHSQWPKISHISNITIDGSCRSTFNAVRVHRDKKHLCLSCL